MNTMFILPFYEINMVFAIISFFDISLTNSFFILVSLGFTKNSLFSNKFFRFFLFLLVMFFCLELFIFCFNFFVRPPVVESLPVLQPVSVKPEVPKVIAENLTVTKSGFSAQNGFCAKSNYVFEQLPVDIQVLAVFCLFGLPFLIWGVLTLPPTPPTA